MLHRWVGHFKCKGSVAWPLIGVSCVVVFGEARLPGGEEAQVLAPKLRFRLAPLRVWLQKTGTK